MAIVMIMNTSIANSNQQRSCHATSIEGVQRDHVQQIVGRCWKLDEAGHLDAIEKGENIGSH